MQAKDVMTTDVVTVGPDTSVNEIAARLLERRISAVPVVDQAGKVIGIVSEGDLMRRPETGTERQPSWWLRLFGERAELAREFVKEHGRRAADVMTSPVISVGEEATLDEIATLLERHRIKRVTVMRDGRLVGIVSRANLIQGLVAKPMPSHDDRSLREMLGHKLEDAGVRTMYLDWTVSGGVVRLWGAVSTREEKDAARIAAESLAGVREVANEINVVRDLTRTGAWI